MLRISRLNGSAVALELRSLYDKLLQYRGNLPYLFLTLLYRLRSAAPPPRSCRQFSPPAPSLRLKELAVVRTSQLDGTAYCHMEPTMRPTADELAEAGLAPAKEPVNAWLTAR